MSTHAIRPEDYTTDVERLIAVRNHMLERLRFLLLYTASTWCKRTQGRERPMQDGCDMAVHGESEGITAQLALPNAEGFSVRVKPGTATDIATNAALMNAIAGMLRLPKEAALGRSRDNHFFAIVSVPGGRLGRMVISIREPSSS